MEEEEREQERERRVGTKRKGSARGHYDKRKKKKKKKRAAASALSLARELEAGKRYILTLLHSNHVPCFRNIFLIAKFLKEDDATEGDDRRKGRSSSRVQSVDVGFGNRRETASHSYMCLATFRLPVFEKSLPHTAPSAMEQLLFGPFTRYTNWN
ncbi:hypothetical protein V8G54_013834 [Vigna mungo]|uniref:Uncharacterized protein n=1 Tax=Vigna mungo TaxID=3915 RepID=A0AAQ3RYQ2_VIGMU